MAVTNPVAARFAELVEALLAGDRAPLRRVIEASGAEWWEGGDGSITVRRGSFVAGVSTSEPGTAAVCVGFAIAGPLWAHIPEIRAGAELVRSRWEAQRKAARAVQA